jgi:hypothetical protein
VLDAPEPVVEGLGQINAEMAGGKAFGRQGRGIQPVDTPMYSGPVKTYVFDAKSVKIEQSARVVQGQNIAPDNTSSLKPDFIGTSNGDVANISNLSPNKRMAVERELRVAEIVDGRSATKSRIRERDGKLIVEDTPIIRNGQVVSGVDVIGKNGELIQVGGPGKNANDVVFEKTKRSLEVLKDEARLRGTKAQVFFEQGNSDRFKELVRESQRILGEDNVFILSN